MNPAPERTDPPRVQRESFLNALWKLADRDRLRDDVRNPDPAPTRATPPMAAPVHDRRAEKH